VRLFSSTIATGNAGSLSQISFFLAEKIRHSQKEKRGLAVKTKNWTKNKNRET
jgi:hypothetical protein